MILHIHLALARVDFAVAVQAIGCLEDVAALDISLEAQLKGQRHIVLSLSSAIILATPASLNSLKYLTFARARAWKSMLYSNKDC